MKWHVIDTGVAAPEEHMAMDSKLLKSMAVDPQPIIRFYDWPSNSATYGYFTEPQTHLKKTQGLHLARRPTGGGILFHQWDMTFSILLPSTHKDFSLNTGDNYIFVNRCIAAAIEKTTDNKPLLLEKEEPCDNICTHFCMAHPTLHDVMIAGKKVCGGAQRRTRYGFLHQGSLSLIDPDYDYLTACVSDTLVASMQKNAGSLFKSLPLQRIQEVKNALQAQIIKEFSPLTRL